MRPIILYMIFVESVPIRKETRKKSESNEENVTKSECGGGECSATPEAKRRETKTSRLRTKRTKER